MNTDAGAVSAPYPSPRYAWYVVVLLTLGYITSFVDRQILGLLITPIKSSMDLSDTQLGLLMGPAFAIFYVTLGYPIGWLADRRNRRNIIAAGIAFWCVMTALSGLSRNFTQLFLARIGVGVGEATLTPSALSLISDYFPKERRARAVSFYMMGISLGSGLAYVVGGKVVALVTAAPTVTWPIVGELYSWQSAFLVVGLPGLIVALAMFTVKEPQRRERAALGSGEELSLGDTLRFIATRWRSYGALSLGMCATTTIAYSQSWNVALFQRTWEWDVARIGLSLGITMLIFGPIGANFGGWMADRFTAKGLKDGPLRMCFIAVALMVPSAALFPLMPTPELALGMNVLSTLANAMASACGSAAIVTLAPNQFRAQATALYWLAINLCGLTLGPTMVGWLTDAVFHDPKALPYGMAIVAVGIGVPALLALWRGLPHYAAGVVEVEKT